MMVSSKNVKVSQKRCLGISIETFTSSSPNEEIINISRIISIENSVSFTGTDIRYSKGFGEHDLNSFPVINFNTINDHNKGSRSRVTRLRICRKIVRQSPDNFQATLFILGIQTAESS